MRITFTTLICIILWLPSLAMGQSRSNLDLFVGFEHSDVQLDGFNSGFGVSSLPVSSFTGGVGFTYHVSNHWSFGMKGMFVRRGMSEIRDIPLERDNAIAVESNDYWTSDYVEVTPKIEYSLSLGAITPYCYAGMGASFLVASQNTLHGTTSVAWWTMYTPPANIDTSFHPQGEMNSSLFSVLIGAGLRYKIFDNEFAFVEGAYDYGLTSVSKGYPENRSEDLIFIESLTPMAGSNVNVRDFRINVGVSFEL